MVIMYGGRSSSVHNVVGSTAICTWCFRIVEAFREDKFQFVITFGKLDSLPRFMYISPVFLHNSFKNGAPIHLIRK